MTRRCLLIAGVFPPAGGAGAVRMAKLCKYLQRRGWAIDVLAPPGELGWARDTGLLDDVAACAVARPALPWRWPATVTGLRAAAKDPRAVASPSRMRRAALDLGRILRNRLVVPDELLPWSVLAARAAKRLVDTRRYDVVLTSSPPHSVHLAGLAVAYTSNVPWVAELRDPWVGNPTRGHAGPMRRSLEHRLERMLVTRADALVVVTETMAKDLEKRYGARVAAKLNVITNGFDPEGIGAQPTHRENSLFDLTYVGSFDSTLTPPEAALAGLARFAREHPELASRLRLRIVGSADLRAADALRRHMQETPGAAVVVEGFVSHRDALRAMASADALLLVLAPGAAWVLTSKVFEYLGSAAPILAIVPEGDCRELLRRCGGAAVFSPHEVGRLAAHLAKAATSRQLPVDSPRNSQIIADFTWPKLAARFDKVLTGMDRATRQRAGVRDRLGR